MNNLKAIFFDFGGCLDGNGIHPRAQFLNAFHRLKLIDNTQDSAFQLAYSAADQKIFQEGSVCDLGLLDTNRVQAKLILDYMSLSSVSAGKAAEIVTNFQRSNLFESRKPLENLQSRFLLGIISNFSGNLKIILEETKMLSYFTSVTESYYVGFSKPDPRLFQHALTMHNLAPSQCLFVGDSIERDILPAKALGMKTVIVKGALEKTESLPATCVRHIMEIPNLLLLGESFV